MLEDHLGECVTCRRELKNGRRPAVASSPSTSRPGWVWNAGWRVAAAAAVLLLLVGISVETDLFSFEAGGVIRVDSVDGDLFRLTDDGTVPVSAGDVLTLEQGRGVRTGRARAPCCACTNG